MRPFVFGISSFPQVAAVALCIVPLVGCKSFHPIQFGMSSAPILPNDQWREVGPAEGRATASYLFDRFYNGGENSLYVAMQRAKQSVNADVLIGVTVDEEVLNFLFTTERTTIVRGVGISFERRSMMASQPGSVSAPSPAPSGHHVGGKCVFLPGARYCGECGKERLESKTQ